VVNGLGGIGKTEVCRRYWWQHYGDFSHLGWINYRDGLKESFFNRITALPAAPNETVEEHFSRAVDFLANLPDHNTLFIVDNIDNLNDPGLAELRRLPLKVIATTRLE
jgi:hypothetical protein